MEQKDRGPIIDLAGSRYFEFGKKPADNSVEAINKLFKNRSKFIRVEGITGIADKEIAIYNDKGILARALFETPFAYVYELAIPLKSLSLNANSMEGFAYQIKINFPNLNEKLPPPPPPNVLVINHPQGANDAVTDFWGEYTLAK